MQGVPCYSNLAFEGDGAVQIVAARLSFHLAASNSLKDKRQVSRSLVSRLRQRFNVSVAEVDAHDLWQSLVLGVACVSNQAQHANQMLDVIVDYIHALRLEAELVEVERETMVGP